MQKKTKKSGSKITTFFLYILIITAVIMIFSILNFLFIGIYLKEDRITKTVSKIKISKFNKKNVKFEHNNPAYEAFLEKQNQLLKEEKIRKIAEEKEKKSAKKKAEIVKVDDKILSDLLTPLKNGETKVQLYAEILNSRLGPITYFNQSDYRWAKHKYGKSTPMYSAGCGPTTMAMVIDTIDPDNYITPDKMANIAYLKGCYIDGGGSTHNIVKKCADEYNIPVRAISASADNIKNSLDNNKLVVALVGRGKFTEGGHFILITSMDKNGKLSIADPISIENTHKKWDANFIISQLKKSASSGPLWELG